MKPNIYDLVLDKTVKRVDDVSTKIATQFKNIKPFNKEPIPKSEMLNAYRGLTMDDMVYLIQKHGRDKVNDLIYELEMEKSKEIRNA
jgi:hypothetical protein